MFIFIYKCMGDYKLHVLTDIPTDMHTYVYIYIYIYVVEK